MSETIERAFRAAFLLTGSTGAAENALLNGVAMLARGGNVDQAVLRSTVEFAIRCAAGLRLWRSSLGSWRC